MRVPSVRILAFTGGLAAAVVVTRGLHVDPDAGIWGKRLPGTRLRFANLPVGGTIAIVLSTRLPRPVAGPVAALGAGAFAGAVGWGLADPLPAT